MSRTDNNSNSYATSIDNMAAFFVESWRAHKPVPGCPSNLPVYTFLKESFKFKKKVIDGFGKHWYYKKTKNTLVESCRFSQDKNFGEENTL
jgi:hypothetical protein